MKKIVYIIVTIFLFFATSSMSFARGDSLESLLDLDYGVEAFSLHHFSSLGTYKFKDDKTQKIFSGLQSYDTLLKKEFMRLYRNWKLDYTAMNAVVKNYNYFIYYINRKFLYERLKEVYWNSKEINNAIIENYQLSRNYFIKVRNILKRNR